MSQHAITRRSALALMGLCAASCLVPARIAGADTQQQLDAAQAKLEEVQKQLDDISAQYEALAEKQNQTKKQIESVQATIEDTQEQIDDKTEDLQQKKAQLSKRISLAYKGGNAGILNVLFSSTSFAELSSNIYYLDKISEHDRLMIEAINRVKAELTQRKEELEEQKRTLEQLHDEQKKELKSMQEKQDETQQLLNGLSKEVKDLLAQRDAELKAAAEEKARQEREAAAARAGRITYNRVPVTGTLNLSPGLSAAQQKVIRTSYGIASPGLGLCAMWVSQVFSAAGYGYPSGNANDMYASYCNSSNKSDLKPGMVIAVPSHPGTRAGRIYGHIGIYIGNGIVRHNIGSISEQSLDSWIAFYGKTNTPRWGWCMGKSLL